MKRLLTTFIGIVFIQLGFAQTTTFSGSGNWNSGARWSNGIPDGTKDAIIANNSTCTVNVNNARCNSLTLATGNRATTVIISGSNVLTVDEDVVVEVSTSDSRHKKIDIANGTMHVGGNLYLENSGDNDRDAIIDIGNGTLNLTGTFDLAGTSGDRCILDFTGTGTMNIGGTIIGSGLLNEGSGTINYNNAGAQTIAATTYNNLSISGSGTKTAGGSFTVNGTLNLIAGSLSINGNTLTINGTTSRTSGNIIGSTTSNITVGGTGGTGTLYMSQTSSSTRSLNNLTITRPNGLTIDDTLELDNTLSVSNGGVLNTNNKLILISNVSGTARVADLSNGTVNGKVIAQRYVPGGNGRRRWRFFSSPANVSGNYNYYQFIDDMFVTGAGGAANGFDNSPNNSSSARTYDETVTGASSNGWANPTVLNTNIPVGKGVSVFVRGSRNTQDPFLNWATPDNTTVDFTGNLNQGTYDISSQLTYTPHTPTADGFNLIGNPYMSNIDWTSGNITKTNIGNVIYVINPSTGAYATYDVSTETSVNGGSPLIASSQGFFIRTTAANPSVIFRETAKTSSNLTPTFFREHKSSVVFPKLKLKATRDNENTDELVIVLGDTAHKAGTDLSDAAKFFNDNNLNFYSRSTELRNLAINYFPIPTANDTISLSFFSFVDGVKALGTYNIKLESVEYFPKNLDVFLVDLYANQTVNLKQANSYVFNLDANAASAGNDRFKLIFKPDTSTVTKINNFYGQVNASNISVHWNTNKEKNIAYYTVEKSTDLKKFSLMKPNQVVALNNNSGYNLYNIIDTKPTKGYNYYRVSMVDSNGNKSTYGEIISVLWTKQNAAVAENKNIQQRTIVGGTEDITIYPNPASDFISFNVFTDTEEYHLVHICDINGRILSTERVASYENKILDVSNLEKGLYLIRSISETSGKSLTSKFIKE